MLSGILLLKGHPIIPLARVQLAKLESLVHHLQHTLRAARHWHRLHREVVVPRPWRQPGSGWMGSEHLMELWVSLCIAGGLDQMAFNGFFQLKQIYDSTNKTEFTWFITISGKSLSGCDIHTHPQPCRNNEHVEWLKAEKH